MPTTLLNLRVSPPARSFLCLMVLLFASPGFAEISPAQDVPAEDVPAEDVPAEDVPAETTANTGLELEAMDLCEAATGAYLNARLFGSIATQLDWNEQTMDCDGMTRPNENGIRLVFSGPGKQERLLIVIGIDGDFAQLMEGERKANITLIAEETGRFYSAVNQDRCWTTIDEITAVSEETTRIYKVSGEAYCAGSLPSLSDNTSITIRNLSYSGRLSMSEFDDE